MNPTMISGSTAGHAASTIDILSEPSIMIDLACVSTSWASRALFIPSSQAYFWTLAWQRAEAEADADIQAGRVEHFDSMADAIASLKADGE